MDTPRLPPAGWPRQQLYLAYYAELKAAFNNQNRFKVKRGDGTPYDGFKLALDLEKLGSGLGEVVDMVFAQACKQSGKEKASVKLLQKFVSVKMMKSVKYRVFWKYNPSQVVNVAGNGACYLNMVLEICFLVKDGDVYRAQLVSSWLRNDLPAYLNAMKSFHGALKDHYHELHGTRDISLAQLVLNWIRNFEAMIYHIEMFNNANFPRSMWMWSTYNIAWPPKYQK